MSTRDLGGQGETIAIQILQNHGYKILQRNFRCKIGEIDIIALDKEVLVFIEVKTRWSLNYGLPEEAITPWKIRKIARVGEYYKLLHPELPESLRIDAVCIDMNQARLIKNISPL